MLMARLKTWQELGLERHVPVFADEDRGADEPACGRRGISFLSNDYLGLASDRRWQQQVAECFAVAAPSASASRLAGGHRESMCKAEQELMPARPMLWLVRGLGSFLTGTPTWTIFAGALRPAQAPCSPWSSRNRSSAWTAL